MGWEGVLQGMLDQGQEAEIEILRAGLEYQIKRRIEEAKILVLIGICCSAPSSPCIDCSLSHSSATLLPWPGPRGFPSHVTVPTSRPSFTAAARPCLNISSKLLRLTGSLRHTFQQNLPPTHLWSSGINMPCFLYVFACLPVMVFFFLTHI